MQAITDQEPRKGTFAFTLKPLTDDAIPALIDYVNECAALEEAVETITLEEFLQWHNSPMNHDHHVLAFLQNEDGSEGRIIGDMGIGQNPPDTRAWGSMHVHPDFRNNGVGTALYNAYMQKAEELGSTTVAMTPSRHATCLVDYLNKRDFVLERYFWDMRLRAEQTVESAAAPEGFTFRTFVPGQDEELLTHVRNVTFAEHYGSVPRTVEEMTYRTKQPDFFPDGLFFAFEGEQVAGFCYTSRDEREWERRGERVGHIQLLGVMPDYRGRGIGRALLLQGVNYLRQYVDIVELGVEGKNNKALALYESVGFHQHKAWANMLREIKS